MPARCAGKASAQSHSVDLGTRDRAKDVGRRRMAGHKRLTAAVDRRPRRSVESTGGETNRHHSVWAIGRHPPKLANEKDMHFIGPRQGNDTR